MYILSNGIKITEKMHQCLCQAIKDDSGKFAYFLDMETGKFMRIPRIHRRKLEATKREARRFIPLPKVSKEERRKHFVSFVEELGIIDVAELENRLREEIKKGAPIDKLEQILENDPSGWIHGWVQDEQFLLAERIEEWITQPPLNAKDDPDYWYDDNCSVCQLIREMEEENRFSTLNETHQAFKKAKEQDALVGGELFEKLEKKEEREDGFKKDSKVEDFKMPKWMECTWRRVPCGKDDCLICGRIKKDRQRHIERGENPDDMKCVLEDVNRSFKEAMEMIKKDAERMGIEITNIKGIKEPPRPEKFLFYQRIKEWNKEVFKLADEAELSGHWWIYTEAAADLFWYANILTAKVYRQLCNRWHIEDGDDYGDFDYQYTQNVLKECLKILKKSLRELINSSQFQKEALNSLLSELLKIEKEIVKI